MRRRIALAALFPIWIGPYIVLRAATWLFPADSPQAHIDAVLKENQ